MMFSEPTISPNFVVRQKRKVSRNPLIIMGVVGMFLLVGIGLMSLTATPVTPEETPVPTVNITFESRIVFQSTPQPTQATNQSNIILENRVTIPAPNSNNTTSQTESASQATCTITPADGANINVRSGPDLTFSIISSLSAGQNVGAIAVSDNLWYQIKTFDGSIGWVGGSVTDEKGDCASLRQVKTPVCSVKNTTGNRVNIRYGASTSKDIIRVLLVEDLLMADGKTQDGWYRVALNTQMGWIYQDVVSLSDACATLPIISASEPVPDVVNISNVSAGSNGLAFDADDCVIESFNGNTIDLHEGPGLEYAVVAKMNKAMAVSQRSTNGWYEVDGFGWAFAGDLVYRGLCNLLPTISPEEARGSVIVMSRG